MQIFDKHTNGEREHVTGEQLLMFLDGELTAKEAAAVQRHVEACWECRARLAEAQNTIARFIQLQRKVSERALSSAESSGALRVRLRERGSYLDKRPAFKLRLVLATVACALLVVAGIHLLSSNDYNSVLKASLVDAMPSARLTPGEVVTRSSAEVCSTNDESAGGGVIPALLARRVFEMYGLKTTHPEDFEVDYLITPDLGGAQTVHNLWPEPYYDTIWNAHVKDQLEDRLHLLVCSGKVDLADAQREIAVDWITSYKKRFRTDQPFRQTPAASALLLLPQPSR